MMIKTAPSTEGAVLVSGICQVLLLESIMIFLQTLDIQEHYQMLWKKIKLLEYLK